MEKAIDLNIASLIKICDHAKQYDIMIGVENAMNDRNMVGKTFGEMERLLRGVGRNNLGITFDVGHANLTRNIDDYIAKKDYIVEVHAHDNFGYTDEHLAIGEGKINWGSVYDRIKDMNCALVLEQKTMEDALKSFKYLDGLSIDGSAYQRLNMLLLEIKAEKSARDLLPINNDMTRLCESVLAFGATGSNINHIVSSCRDAMTFRVAEMVLDEMSPPWGVRAISSLSWPSAASAAKKWPWSPTRTRSWCSTIRWTRPGGFILRCSRKAWSRISPMRGFPDARAI